MLPVAALTALAILPGCSSNECYDNHSALPLAAFYSSATMRGVSLQGLEIYGLGAPGDSVLYTPQTLSQAYLPFRFGQDSTVYVFSYRYGVEDSDSIGNVAAPSDTVVFRYHPEEWFVSPACGAMYFFRMGQVTHTSVLIDSISCNETITNENASNIKIFFREE